MDIQTFQNKLEEVCRLAAGNGNMLTAQQVKTFFAELDLNREQLVQIVKYLSVRGIAIEGMETKNEESGEQSAVSHRALTQEEKEYLRDYRDSFGNKPFVADKAKEWLARLADGEEEARGILAELYLPLAADIAVELVCEGVFLQDMIQEANVSLLTALQITGEEQKTDEWLQREIRSGLKLFIEEQTQQKFEDDALVERVERLERTVKELTDEDEDGQSGTFSVEDLAILLDMDLEEMEDTLRLTGGM